MNRFLVLIMRHSVNHVARKRSHDCTLTNIEDTFNKCALNEIDHSLQRSSQETVEAYSGLQSLDNRIYSSHVG